MTSAHPATPPSLYLLDSSQLQRSNLQDADGYLIWLTATLIGVAHGALAVYCLSFSGVEIGLANVMFALMSFGFALYAKHQAHSPWIHPLAVGLLLSGTSFLLHGYPGPIVIFPYILMPLPAFRVLGLHWGGVLMAGFLASAALSLFGGGVVEMQMSSSVRINVMISLCIATGFGWAFEYARRRADLNLEDMLKKLRVLHGVIPICSSCKMVREEGDSWRQIEELLHQKGQVEFSHGLCGDCLHEAMEDLGGGA
ncbi:MAG: hypothetical protein ACPG31_09725 [Planctomycetota bacterium]